MQKKKDGDFSFPKMNLFQIKGAENKVCYVLFIILGLAWVLIARKGLKNILTPPIFFKLQ